jgi:hypothetical protein
MQYAKPWEHPSTVATLSIVVLLSARINSSTCCRVARSQSSTGRPGRASSATFETSLREFLGPVMNRFKWQTLPTVNRKHLFMNILWIEYFCPQKTHNRTLLLGRTQLKHRRHFDYWNNSLNMCMRVCYLDSWSWTVLLPSDTHRKPITSIAVALFPFVTYLLTVSRIKRLCFSDIHSVE